MSASDAERSLHDARAVLGTTTARWLALAETIPGHLVARDPTPGEWSALACLQHLVDNEELVMLPRLEAILAGRDFDPNHPRSRRTAPESSEHAAALARDLARRFDELRTATLRIVDTLRDRDLARSARHPRHGLVTMATMLQYWAGHDLMHTVQAERAVMQPFIEAAGPWRPAFADHDVGAEDARDGDPGRER